jgi:ribosomal protein L39E
MTRAADLLGPSRRKAIERNFMTGLADKPTIGIGKWIVPSTGRQVFSPAREMRRHWRRDSANTKSE